MTVIEAINKEYLKNTKHKVKAIDSPLYQKKDALVYFDIKGEVDKFFPDDNYSLIIGHLINSGRVNPNNEFYDQWVHEVDCICIGSHSYLNSVINAINLAGGSVKSYDLRGYNVWRQYFGIEEYMENQVFVIKYTITGKVEYAVNDMCEPCE